MSNFPEGTEPKEDESIFRYLYKICLNLWKLSQGESSLSVTSDTATRNESFNVVTCGASPTYVVFPNVAAQEVVVVNDSGQDLTIRRVAEPSKLWVLKDGYTEPFWVAANTNELECKGTAALDYKLKIRRY